MSTEPQHIRNFSIIAHIDHGKSTLADRILDFTGALSARERVEQFLDKMDIERERGITIKAQHVRLHYTADDGQLYQLNLIDTPGHVDFTYEVSRSLSACEGALLVVDCTQGVEAQTLANVYLAVEANLNVIPVLNKVDLPSADPDRTRQEIEDVVGIDASEAVLASGKTGIGIKDILESVVKKVKPPGGRPEGPPARPPLRQLVRQLPRRRRGGAVMEGTLRKGDKIYLMATQREYEVTEIGVFTPHPVALERARVPARWASSRPTSARCTTPRSATPSPTPRSARPRPSPGTRTSSPWCSRASSRRTAWTTPPCATPSRSSGSTTPRFRFDPDTSDALGFGFRCGFLGLLHMEIIQERLEREYNLDLITTAPSVVYRVRLRVAATPSTSRTPSRLPDPGRILAIDEPFLKVTLHTPATSVGVIMQLCQDRRGTQIGMQYNGPSG
jgi:GTP-binding protein LepA